MEIYPITKEDKLLIEKAMTAIKKNFDSSKYYHTVGAALRCQNGDIFLGVNCDEIHGSCAEYIAVGGAITAGRRDFETIVAVHPEIKNLVLSPCGNCRQMLWDYAPMIKVIVQNEDGDLLKVAIKDLLPFAYVQDRT